VERSLLALKKLLAALAVVAVVVIVAGLKWTQWSREQEAALRAKEQQTLESIDVFVLQRRFVTARDGLRGCMKTDLASSRRLHLKEASLQMSCGRFEEALALLKAWAPSLHDDPASWMQVARCLWLLDRLDDCEKQLLELQKVAPALPGLAERLAEVHARQALRARDPQARHSLLDKAFHEASSDSLYARAIRASILLDRGDADGAARELDPLHQQTFVVRAGPHSLQEVDAYAQHQGVLAAALLVHGDQASASKAFERVRVAASGEFDYARAQVRALGTPATRIDPFLQTLSENDTPVVVGFVGLEASLVGLASTREQPELSLLDFVPAQAVALSDDRASLPAAQLAFYQALQGALEHLKEPQTERSKADIAQLVTCLRTLGPSSPPFELVLQRLLPASLQIIIGDSLLRAHRPQAEARAWYVEAEKEPFVQVLARQRLSQQVSQP
jgi:tetratricopeptide (TPR) repeat protein